MAVNFNTSNGAKLKTIEFPVSTKETDPATGEYVLDTHGKPKKKEKMAVADVPAPGPKGDKLRNAILAEGEDKVWRRYVQSLVIELQGEHRRDLQEKAPGERGNVDSFNALKTSST